MDKNKNRFIFVIQTIRKIKWIGEQAKEKKKKSIGRRHTHRRWIDKKARSRNTRERREDANGRNM